MDTPAVRGGVSDGGVRLVSEGGRTPHLLASDLGCSEEAIRTWVRQAVFDEGRRADGPTSTGQAELAQLRRENRVLRTERDLLKKAAVFFARESEPTW